MALGFGQVADILMLANNLHPDKRDTFLSRLKQWQKMGFPAGVNVGRGTRAEYRADELFQLAFHMRLLTLGLTPERAQEVIKAGWPKFRFAMRLGAEYLAQGHRTLTYLAISYDSLTDLKEKKFDHNHIFVMPLPHAMLADALYDFDGEFEEAEEETEDERETRSLTYYLIRNLFVNGMVVEAESVMIRIWAAMAKLGIAADSLKGDMHDWPSVSREKDDPPPTPTPQMVDNLAGVEFDAGDTAATLLGLERTDRGSNP